jgi:hypothetical protein
VTGVTVVGVRGHLVAEPSAEDSAALHAIMAISPGVNRERLEFLGGSRQQIVSTRPYLRWSDGCW